MLHATVGLPPGLQEALAAYAEELVDDTPYERVTSSVDGQWESGSPLVYDAAFGWCTVDEEFPKLADGGRVERRVWARGNGQGAVEYGSQLVRVGGSSHALGLRRMAARSGRFTWKSSADQPAVPRADASPTRFQVDVDYPGGEKCWDNDEGQEMPYLSTLNHSTGVNQYIDHHFTGAGVEGIAAWARANMGVIDPVTGAVTKGEQPARSGVARDVRLVFGNELAPFLAVATAAGWLPDVVSRSASGNTGANPNDDADWDVVCRVIEAAGMPTPPECRLAANSDPEFRRYYCPTKDQARGLDDGSQAVNAAWYDGVLTVKSAGNMHHADDLDSIHSVVWCELYDPDGSAACEVSAPGAAATALSVGAMENHINTTGVAAYDTQRISKLYSKSSRGGTLDGRTYPLMAVASWQCGCANYNRYLAGDHRGYTDLGATSGAQPRVAGSALVFKHWYAYRYDAATANEPGRLIASMLNLSGGYVDPFANGGIGPLAAAQAPPEELTDGVGVGQLRMRLFEDETMSGSWHYGCTSHALVGGEVVVLDVGDGGPVPEDAHRLRVTVWWPEMNTGEGEAKAEVFVGLWDRAEGAFHTWRTSTNADPIRLGWSCRRGADRTTSYPPSGELDLVIWAVATPTEERGYERDYRTFYVAWFWEEGDDTTTIYSNTDEGDCDAI